MHIAIRKQIKDGNFTSFIRFSGADNDDTMLEEREKSNKRKKGNVVYLVWSLMIDVDGGTKSERGTNASLD